MGICFVIFSCHRSVEILKEVTDLFEMLHQVVIEQSLMLKIAVGIITAVEKAKVIQWISTS